LTDGTSSKIPYNQVLNSIRNSNSLDIIKFFKVKNESLLNKFYDKNDWNVIPATYLPYLSLA